MKSIFTRTQNTILSAAFVLFVSSGVSAILGIFKNRLLAAKFGVSDELAVFYTADRIPGLVYSVLVVGALSTIFIPVFAEELKKNKEKAFLTASTLINTVFLFFLFFSTLIWLFSEQIINLLSVGKFTHEQVVLGALLMKYMLFAQMLLVAGSLASSVLQSFKQFLMPALAPVAYNVGMIAGIYFFSSRYGILAPAIGALIGSAAHFLIQIPFLMRTGFRLSLGIDFKNRSFNQVAGLAPPRIASVLITNLLATINNSLAILISSAAVIYLKFGIQLQTFPVTLFGASIAAASLPTLSSESDEHNLTQFKKTFLTSFHQMMFLVLPASVILLVLRIPVVRLVYGVANFPWEATVNTGLVLGVLTLSIFPQSANYLISRAFYALKDTSTPVKISAVTIVINVVLSLFFINTLKWGVWAVAVSYAVTSALDTLLMLIALSHKVSGLKLRDLVMPFMKMALAAALMGITLYLPIKLLDQVIFDTTKTLNLIFLTGIAGFCGLATYFLFTKMLNIPEVELFYKLIRKLDLRETKVSPPTESLQ